MKKILLLGGSSQQVIAIETAKRLGYYTILCDYLPDNPGQYVADKFYQVSTTDKDAVLQIAKQESIYGIVAYSSDPAAPTAAYVSEALSLPGIPYCIAEAFCNKHLFRKFLNKNGFNVPGSVELSATSTVDDVAGLVFPIIIKPTDSSGSKGVSVIKDASEFDTALRAACSISRNGVLIAEEFIVRDHPDVIEAELFVIDGRVAVWGLMNTVRDPYTNPLLPAAYSYPLTLTDGRVSLVRSEVQKLIDATGVQYGAFNIEMIITKDEELYFLDAGPRNGGNELPEFIGRIMGDDLVSATIYAAMGEYDKLKGIGLDGKSNGFWGMYVLHSSRAGVFQKIAYDEMAQLALYRESFFKEPGEKVGAFDISRDAIGLAFFRFSDQKIRDEIMTDFKGRHIKTIVD